MNEVLGYYEKEAGKSLADRFFTAFFSALDEALESPKSCHPATQGLRRAKIHDFPYHFLFRETPNGIRILVLRHDRRHPSYGMTRR